MSTNLPGPRFRTDADASSPKPPPDDRRTNRIRPNAARPTPSGIRAVALAIALATPLPAAGDAPNDESVVATDGTTASAEASVGTMPLHERIDRWLLNHAQTSGDDPGPVADDAAFLRRTTLALMGRTPGLDETLAFLAESPSGDPDKRRRLVEDCLGSPDFVRHMAVTLDVMLMERRADTHVGTAEWRAFLEEGIRSKVPFDALVRSILSADGADPTSRPAARFLLAREAESHLLTRDIGRLFLGVDLQCAQCHDHPRIDDYRQRDYHGIHAFLTRTYLFQPDPAKPALVGEKAEGEAAFTSVFTKLGDATPPRLPGLAVSADAALGADTLWEVPPDDKDKSLRPVPRYSRRAKLAAELTRPDNRVFARNLANRLWAHLMGRGLIEPLDLAHAENPPAHPELLEVVTDGVVELNFDLAAILRELALCRIFQGPFDLPPPPSQEDRHRLSEKASELESALAEATTRARDSADAFKSCRSALDDALRHGAQRNAAVTAESEALAALRKEIEPLDLALAEATRSLEEAMTRASTLASAVQATESAVDSAPSPDAIRTALATLHDQSSQAANAVASLASARQTAESARAARQDALAAAESGLAAAEAARQAAEIALTEARTSCERALETRNNAVSLRQHLENRLGEVRAILAHAAALDAANSASLTLTAAQERLAARQAESEALNLRIAAFGTGDPPLAQELTAMASLHSAAESDLAAIAERLARVAKSADEIRNTGEEFGLAPGLTAATATMAARAATLRTDSTAFLDRVHMSRNALESIQDVANALDVRLIPVRDDLRHVESELAESRREVEASAAAAVRAQETLSAAEAALVESRSASFALRPLVPLTPEQLAWSMLSATGQWENLRAQAIAEHDAKRIEVEAKTAEAAAAATPDSPPPTADPIPSVEELFEARIRAQTDPFVRLFGNGAAQPQTGFFATADQALFLENSDVPRVWLSPGGASLVERLMQIDDPAALVRHLYLGILTRPPTDAETALGVEHLSADPERKLQTVQDLGWALLTSAEFRFNH